MVSIKRFLCLTPLIIFGSVVFIAVQNSGVLKTFTLHEGGYTNCQYIEKDYPGPEDITAYNSTTLIASHGDYAQIWALGLPKHEQNHILAIFDADKPSFRVVELPLINYPKDLSFHPHGITIRIQSDGEYLYLVNHAYQYGGERIEPGTMELHYQFTIQPDQQLWNGILNDIIVVKNDHFIVTTYQPVPDPLEGRKFRTPLQNLYVTLCFILNIKTTRSLSCKFTAPSSISIVTPDCQILQQTLAVVNNGITWDGQKNVYIADTLSNRVNHFRLVDSPDVLEYQGYIQNDGGIDNVEYDPITRNVYVGTFGKLIEHLNLEHGINQEGRMSRTSELEFWSIVNEFSTDPTNPDYNQIKPVIRSNKINKGLSAGYKLGTNLWLGSWGDPTLMVCQKKQ